MMAAVGVAPQAKAKDGAPDSWEFPVEGMERVAKTVWVKELTRGIWVTCFTFDTSDLGWVPCNGLIVADAGGPIIVDTGNNAEQGEVLLAQTKRLTGRAATQAIATHFHNDRTGGGVAMRAANVPVYAHPFSVGLAQAYGFPAPTPLKGLEKGPVNVGSLEVFFPGAAHTRDNITVWHKDTATLFGGCMIRATTDKGVGSKADADMASYPLAVDRLIQCYPDRRITVPGHGSAAGDALAWTRQLLAALPPPRP
jgi:metallo-beta-lactamase class B